MGFNWSLEISVYLVYLKQSGTLTIDKGGIGHAEIRRTNHVENLVKQSSGNIVDLFSKHIVF